MFLGRTEAFRLKLSPVQTQGYFFHLDQELLAVGRQLPAYLLFHRTPPPPRPPALKSTHNLACSAVTEFNTPILQRLLGCQTSPPARHVFARLQQTPPAPAPSAAQQIQSSQVRSERAPVRAAEHGRL